MLPGIKVGPYKEDSMRRTIERAENYVHVYGSSTRKGKRFRSAFTTEQVIYLEKEFHKYPYVGNSRRKDISNVLDIPERAVKVWFQNRRMKEKKDTPGKEANSDKQVEVNKIVNSSLRTTEDDSLPTISTLENPVQIEVKFAAAKGLEPETNNGKLSWQSTTSETNKEISIVVKNNSKLTKTPTKTSKPSLSLKNNSSDSIDTLMKDESRTHHVKNNSPTNHEPWGKYQKMDYHIYQQPPSSAAIPQDLSSNPAAKFPDVTFSSDNIPFYLREYYSSPYIPPGQIIWNPVNMARLITSASIPGSIGPNLSTMKKKCICDCHKSYGCTMMLQNTPNPNVQYVLSAVPFPDSSPKHI